MFAFRVLAINECLERFAYCGTQLILVLYLAAGHGAGAWGLDSVSLLLGGGGDPTTRAVRLFSVFAAATYIAPIGGAVIATRFGRRRTIAVGCGLMTGGHLLLIDERLLLIGLALLVLGAGCTIANKLSMVGDLLGSDSDRAIGFARYLAAVNLGVVLAPLVCGTLGEWVGWAWGFGAAGVGMAIGMLVFVAGWRSLPPMARATVRQPKARLGAPQCLAIAGALVPFVAVTVVVNQAYTTVPIWATTLLDRGLAGWTMPVSGLITFDGIMSIGAILLTTRLWSWLARRGREPGDIAKLGIGGAIVAVAFAMLALVAGSVPAPLAGALAFYVILDVSAAWIEPPLASFIAAHCPAGRSGLPMAIMKSATAIAALSLGWMSAAYTPLGPPAFWGVNTGIALVASLFCGALVLVMRRRATA